MLDHFLDIEHLPFLGEQFPPVGEIDPLVVEQHLS